MITLSERLLMYLKWNMMEKEHCYSNGELRIRKGQIFQRVKIEF